MPSLGRLFAEIGADLSGLRSAEGQSRNLFSSIQRTGTRAMAALGVATTAATGTIIALTSRSLSNIDAQSKLARAIGGTTTAVQALERAGDRAGVQKGELASAATRLNQRLGEVIATGKGSLDTFNALGISAQRLANMDVDERFMAISDAMRRAGMSSQEMSYHLRQLGIRQASVITLMQSGSEEIHRSRRAIEELGVAINDDQAQAIERANDSLSEMGRVFEGLGNRIAVNVAPMLERMANRFTEMSKEGGALRIIMDRLTDSFMELAEVLTSEEFLEGAARAFEALIGLAENAARVIIFFANNAEIAAFAAAALTAALLGLTGPFGLLATAIGAAAAAAVLFNRRAREGASGLSEYDEAAQAARSAQVALNEAMGTFSETGAPSAAEESVQYANELVKQARAALAAAEAEVALMQAEMARRRELMQSPSGRMELGMEALEGRNGRSPADVLAGELEEAERRADQAALGLESAINRARIAVMAVTSRDEFGEDPSGGSGGGDFEADDPYLKAAGVGSAKDVKDQFEERYEALMEGLTSERELLDIWYEEGLQTLQEAHERGLLTDQEYYDAKLRLQEEYNQNAQRLMQAEVQMRQQTFSAMIGLIQQFGQRNKAAAKIAVALNAAQRVSEIQANTAAAAVRALAELGPIAGPPAAARIKAYGAIQSGIAIASAAMRMSSGGGGGSPNISNRGGGSSGGGGGDVASQPTQTMNMRFVNDPFGIAEQIAREMAKAINEAQRNGTPILLNVDSS